MISVEQVRRIRHDVAVADVGLTRRAAGGRNQALVKFDAEDLVAGFGEGGEEAPAPNSG